MRIHWKLVLFSGLLSSRCAGTASNGAFLSPLKSSSSGSDRQKQRTLLAMSNFLEDPNAELSNSAASGGSTGRRSPTPLTTRIAADNYYDTTKNGATDPSSENIQGETLHGRTQLPPPIPPPDMTPPPPPVMVVEQNPQRQRFVRDNSDAFEQRRGSLGASGIQKPTAGRLRTRWTPEWQRQQDLILQEHLLMAAQEEEEARMQQLQFQRQQELLVAEEQQQQQQQRLAMQEQQRLVVQEQQRQLQAQELAQAEEKQRRIAAEMHRQQAALDAQRHQGEEREQIRLQREAAEREEQQRREQYEREMEQWQQYVQQQLADQQQQQQQYQGGPRRDRNGMVQPQQNQQGRSQPEPIMIRGNSNTNTGRANASSLYGGSPPQQQYPSQGLQQRPQSQQRRRQPNPRIPFSTGGSTSSHQMYNPPPSFYGGEPPPRGAMLDSSMGVVPFPEEVFPWDEDERDLQTKQRRRSPPRPGPPQQYGPPRGRLGSQPPLPPPQNRQLPFAGRPPPPMPGVANGPPPPSQGRDRRQRQRRSGVLRQFGQPPTARPRSHSPPPPPPANSRQKETFRPRPVANNQRPSRGPPTSAAPPITDINFDQLRKDNSYNQNQNNYWRPVQEADVVIDTRTAVNGETNVQSTTWNSASTRPSSPSNQKKAGGFWEKAWAKQKDNGEWTTNNNRNFFSNTWDEAMQKHSTQTPWYNQDDNDNSQSSFPMRLAGLLGTTALGLSAPFSLYMMLNAPPSPEAFYMYKAGSNDQFVERSLDSLDGGGPRPPGSPSSLDAGQELMTRKDDNAVSKSVAMPPPPTPPQSKIVPRMDLKQDASPANEFSSGALGKQTVGPTIPPQPEDDKSTVAPSATNAEVKQAAKATVTAPPSPAVPMTKAASATTTPRSEPAAVTASKPLPTVPMTNAVPAATTAKVDPEAVTAPAAQKKNDESSATEPTPAASNTQTTIKSSLDAPSKPVPASSPMATMQQPMQGVRSDEKKTASPPAEDAASTASPPIIQQVPEVKEGGAVSVPDPKVEANINGPVAGTIASSTKFSPPASASAPQAEVMTPATGFDTQKNNPSGSVSIKSETPAFVNGEGMPMPPSGMASAPAASKPVPTEVDAAGATPKREDVGLTTATDDLKNIQSSFSSAPLPVKNGEKPRMPKKEDVIPITVAPPSAVVDGKAANPAASTQSQTIPPPTNKEVKTPVVDQSKPRTVPQRTVASAGPAKEDKGPVDSGTSKKSEQAPGARMLEFSTASTPADSIPNARIATPEMGPIPPPASNFVASRKVVPISLDGGQSSVPPIPSVVPNTRETRNNPGLAPNAVEDATTKVSQNPADDGQSSVPRNPLVVKSGSRPSSSSVEDTMTNQDATPATTSNARDNGSIKAEEIADATNSMRMPSPAVTASPPIMVDALPEKPSSNVVEPTRSANEGKLPMSTESLPKSNQEARTMPSTTRMEGFSKLQANAHSASVSAEIEKKAAAFLETIKSKQEPTPPTPLTIPEKMEAPSNRADAVLKANSSPSAGQSETKPAGDPFDGLAETEAKQQPLIGMSGAQAVSKKNYDTPEIQNKAFSSYNGIREAENEGAADKTASARDMSNQRAGPDPSRVPVVTDSVAASKEKNAPLDRSSQEVANEPVAATPKTAVQIPAATTTVLPLQEMTNVMGETDLNIPTEKGKPAASPNTDANDPANAATFQPLQVKAIPDNPADENKPDETTTISSGVTNIPPMSSANRAVTEGEPTSTDVKRLQRSTDSATQKPIPTVQAGTQSWNSNGEPASEQATVGASRMDRSSQSPLRTSAPIPAHAMPDVSTADQSATKAAAPALTELTTEKRQRFQAVTPSIAPKVDESATKQQDGKEFLSIDYSVPRSLRKWSASASGGASSQLGEATRISFNENQGGPAASPPKTWRASPPKTLVKWTAGGNLEQAASSYGAINPNLRQDEMQASSTVQEELFAAASGPTYKGTNFGNLGESSESPSLKAAGASLQSPAGPAPKSLLKRTEATPAAGSESIKQVDNARPQPMPNLGGTQRSIVQDELAKYSPKDTNDAASFGKTQPTGPDLPGRMGVTLQQSLFKRTESSPQVDKAMENGASVPKESLSIDYTAPIRGTPVVPQSNFLTKSQSSTPNGLLKWTEESSGPNAVSVGGLSSADNLNSPATTLQEPAPIDVSATSKLPTSTNGIGDPVVYGAKELPKSSGFAMRPPPSSFNKWTGGIIFPSSHPPADPATQTVAINSASPYNRAFAGPPKTFQAVVNQNGMTQPLSSTASSLSIEPELIPSPREINFPPKVFQATRAKQTPQDLRASPSSENSVYTTNTVPSRNRMVAGVIPPPTSLKKWTSKMDATGDAPAYENAALVAQQTTKMSETVAAPSGSVVPPKPLQKWIGQATKPWTPPTLASEKESLEFSGGSTTSAGAVDSSATDGIGRVPQSFDKWIGQANRPWSRPTDQTPISRANMFRAVSQTDIGVGSQDEVPKSSPQAPPTGSFASQPPRSLLPKTGALEPDMVVSDADNPASAKPVAPKGLFRWIDDASQSWTAPPPSF